ncbi:MAG: DUF1501 domain-containing protein [Bryobacteraceae bacterium]
MKNRFGVDWSKTRGTRFWNRPVMHRRMFFKSMATAVGGYMLMPERPGETIARAESRVQGTAKNCIFILMQGAPSHTDTFDLKEGAWTPSFMTPASYGSIRWPQGLMPKLADQIDDFAVVRSVRAYATAHGLAQTWVQIGRNPISGLARIAPHIGSVVSIELGPKSADRTLPPFISLNASNGPGAGYLPPENDPFYVNPNGGGLSNTSHADGAAALDRRYGLMLDLDAELLFDPSIGGTTSEMAHFRENARKLMYNPNVSKIFSFDQAARNLYGNTSFGNACATARNLIKADMGTRFVQITFGSWDHHSNIYQPNANLQSMARQFDNGLGQLMADLKNDGLLDSTLIVAMGEFGRTVSALNQTAGRDHHLQQSAFFAGARIKGRQAIGSTDAAGATVIEPGWSAGREVRNEDIEATIYSALGIDWTTIRRDDPFGRGFEYVPSSTVDYTYQPINELWG